MIICNFKVHLGVIGLPKQRGKGHYKLTTASKEIASGNILKILRYCIITDNVMGLYVCSQKNVAYSSLKNQRGALNVTRMFSSSSDNHQTIVYAVQETHLNVFQIKNREFWEMSRCVGCWKHCFNPWSSSVSLCIPQISGRSKCGSCLCCTKSLTAFKMSLHSVLTDMHSILWMKVEIPTAMKTLDICIHLIISFRHTVAVWMHSYPVMNHAVSPSCLGGVQGITRQWLFP